MNLPPPLNWLWKGWMAFSHVLGRIMSAIILTILWIVGFGLYACVQKIMNMFKKSESAAPASFWIDVAPMGPEHLQRQF